MLKKYKSILIWAGSWMLIYGLLITPWPGAKRIYASYFRSLGQLVFAHKGSRLVLDFQPLNDPQHRWPSNFDTAITVTNHEPLNSTGNQNSHFLTVDSWQMGWVPTAFFAALTLATPIVWRRRITALFWGWLSVQGFIILTLGIFIWDASARLALITLTPFWKGLADGLEELATGPVGPSFFAAAFIWILVTFRRQDFAGKFDLRSFLAKSFPTSNPPGANHNIKLDRRKAKERG